MQVSFWRSVHAIIGAATTVAALAAAPVLGAQERAGPGSIRGVVTSRDTHQPIFSARVSIASPARAAATDERGRYTLRDIPAGTYAVSITALGRSPALDSVRVVGGEATTLDVALEQGSLLLSSVIVSATRTPTQSNQVASTVNVLTPYQIRTSPARETQDLLREIPGVELPRQSSAVGGTSQIVSIRGVDEGRTVVTFDGVPITDAWGEWVDWSKVPEPLLDRVEVVEGGTSNLYGNGAMGGAISFFSRPIAPGSYDLQLDGGSREARHLFASTGVPIARGLSAMLTGDYADGGGYTLIPPQNAGPVDQPSQSIRRNALARLEYAPSSQLSAYLTGHLFGDSRDLGTALSQTNRRSSSIDAGLDYGVLERGQLSLRAWDSEQRENQYVSSVAADRASERRTALLQIPSHDWGAGAQWTRTHLFGLQSFALGADVRHLNGFTGETDFAANGGTSQLLSGGDQLLGGVFAQGVLAPIEPLRVELGARVDHWTNANGVAIDANGATSYPDQSRDAFSPRVGIRYQVARPFSVHAAVYQAFRAPNLAELYRKFTSGANTNLPNPALRPEYARGYEAGLDWQPAQWVQVKGTAYNADMRDLNTFVVIAPNTRQRQNVQKTRSRGGEAYLAVHPIQPLMLSASVNYDDVKIVAGPPGTKIGQRVGRVPVQKQVLRVSYTSPALGSWTVIGRHEGVTTTLQGVPLAPYTVVDASVRREIVPGFTGFVTLENVGNASYQIALTAQNGIASLGLPRTLRVGVEAFRY